MVAMSAERPSALKVCMLTTGFPRFAGDLFGSFIFDLAAYLTRRGVRVEVIAPHAHGFPGREEMSGVRVRRFRYALPAALERLAYGGGIPSNLKSSVWARLLVPFFLLGFLLRAARMVGRSQVVHCHWTICGLIGYLATRGRRRPLVLTVRGSDVHLFSDGLMGKLSRRIWRSMDVIIAVSEDLGRALEEKGVERSRIRVVYNGVREEFKPGSREAARQKLDLPPTRFIALFLGILAPVKGVEVLLQAVEKTAAPDLLQVLVGDGPLRAELEQQAREGGFESNVHFAGQRPREEIVDWLNAADLLVLPSFSEGRPNVVLEAMACGRPVVASRVGGVPELVCDGVTGLLLPAGDSAALSAAIRGLMGDRDRLRTMGTAARECVETSGWTWEAAAAATDEVYSELVAA